MNEKKIFSSSIILLIDNRRKMIMNVLIVSIISALILVFLFPNWYKSSVKIMIPDNSGFNYSDILNSVPMMGSFSSNLSGSELDNIVGMLDSRTVKDEVIKRFNFEKIYEYEDDYFYEDLLNEFSGNVSIEVNYDEKHITLSFYDISPERATQVVSKYIQIADSLISVMYSENASDTRVFLEKQVDIVQSEIDSLKNVMQKFQERSELIAVEEQARILVEEFGMLKSKIAEAKVEQNIVVKTKGYSSNEYKYYKTTVNVLEGMLNELRSGKGEESVYSIKTFPAVANQYYDIYFALKIKEKILEFLYPQYMQAKIDESKFVPNIMILEKAHVPMKKSHPHRSIYLIIIALAVFIINAMVIILSDGFKRYPERFALLSYLSSALKDDFRIFKRNK